MKNCIFIFFILFTTSSFANCVMSSKVRFFYKNQKKEINETACFVSGKIISQKCLTEQGCKAIRHKKLKVGLRDLSEGSYGSPDFRLCYILKGNPFVGHIGKKKKNFCLFDDHSFVETTYLYRFLK